ncbi:C-type lectin mannose-binding isoform-like [Oppia nitens]|uniref:C-type lectin mannose-binding isoform-like n=1 Tax=Oppia nitens TaxID=1686743 RepID=UPI0023DACA08|nr:C-type lectin mannose-binding isoform-like [Oppia nitens]
MFTTILIKSSICEESVETGDRCYYLLTKNATFAEAKQLCRTLHSTARLLSIESKEEQEYVLIALPINIKDMKGGAWIGLQFDAKLKKAVWDSGLPAKYYNWPKSQSNQTMKKTDCIRMSTNTKSLGVWDKHDCKKQLSVVCQVFESKL